MLRFLGVLSLCYLGGCASISVSLAPGHSPEAAAYLQEKLLPATVQAQEDYVALARSKLKQSSVSTTQILVAATKANADKAKAAQPTALVVTLNNSFPDVQQTRTVLNPVRASARLLFERAGLDEARRSPEWFVTGITNEIALDVLRGRHGKDTLTERILRSDDEAELRKTEDRLDPVKLLKQRQVKSSGKFTAMANFMAQTLRNQQGENFYPSLANYLRQLAIASSAEQAFQLAFGLTPEVFATQVDRRLEGLREQKRVHAQSLADWEDLDEESGRALLTTKSMRDHFASYEKLASPKAFVRARSGASVSFDDRAEAIPLALEQCATVDPLGCKVISLDGRFVRPVRSPKPEIDVRMASTGDDAWIKEVQSKWMPLLRKTVDHFNEIVQKRLGYSLKESVRIYVVTSREDYSRALRDQLRLSAARAETSASVAGGTSNQRGQMIVALYPNTPPEMLWEVVITRTLHELTHELQGQIQGDSAGFSSARWLEEATADHLAYLVGKELDRDPSAKYVLEDWRESLIEWYRLRGRTLTKPENVMTANGEQWTRQMVERLNPYQMAGIMSVHLADRLGDGYFPAVFRYWALAAKEGEKEEKAFEACFGVSRAAYMVSLKKWLETL
ncbi:hypothetical protein [Viridibacterium curvum]|uniref:DUF1570 domain-containing protein n=1 Tax=Viridibacterium curvum TaxID=1101404 RepID=A0ABP9QCH8_9RHOO